MDILRTLGITQTDVRKVSVEVADSISELSSLSSYVQSGQAPQNIESVYNKLEKQLEDYLLSSEFKKEAEKAGVKITLTDAEEDVVVEKIPKVKSKGLSERVAERKRQRQEEEARKAVEEAEEVEETQDIEDVDAEDVTDEPEEETTIVGQTEDVDVVLEKEEEPITDSDVISTGELFGYEIKGDRAGSIVASERFSMLLSYGNTDYRLGSYTDSMGIHYRMVLPLSLGQIVISLRNEPQNADLTSIKYVWKSYIADNGASLNIVSRSEDQLKQLLDLLGHSSSTKDRRKLTENELSNEKFNEDEYSIVNDVYSDSFWGDSYFNIARDIKAAWKAESSSGKNYIYGLHFKDYVYPSVEGFYKKGGYTITVKKHEFYVPKGLKRKEEFAELGGHLKETQIKTSKFEKSVEIGKRFQVSTNKFEDAKECRIIATSYGKEDVMYVSDSEGQSYRIKASTYNYFKKYYTESINLEVSDETILVQYNNTVVGLISAEKINNIEVTGMFDIKELKNDLRNINSEAYDFMVSDKTDIEEATEETIEEAEESVEEAREQNTDSEKLKEELVERIEFLKELYEDAEEEDDNQELIDELNSEIEALTDILEDLE